MQEALPEEVRRFLLTSIPTVPHLEMLLLTWREPAQAWSSAAIAARLYIAQQEAVRIADDLCAAGFLTGEGQPKSYRRSSVSDLGRLLALVDAAYSRRLREVTGFIHANPNRTAIRFEPD